MEHKRSETQDKPNTSGQMGKNRRRELLLGAAKGSGILLAGATPVKALASGTTCTSPKAPAPQIRCGISGMASGIGSKDTIHMVCEGYSPGWWGQEDDNKPKHWPAGCDYREKYDVKFGKETLRRHDGSVPTLFQVMKGSRHNHFSSTDTFHWICAYLNALSGGPIGNFPYTAAEVLEFYNGTGKYSYDQALTFFKTYMETHTG